MSPLSKTWQLRLYTHVMKAAGLRSNTPGVLFAAAFALYAVAPAAVYFIPDDSTPLIVAQVSAAFLTSG